MKHDQPGRADQARVHFVVLLDAVVRVIAIDVQQRQSSIIERMLDPFVCICRVGVVAHTYKRLTWSRQFAKLRDELLVVRPW
jgi:hypothetical protein